MQKLHTMTYKAVTLYKWLAIVLPYDQLSCSMIIKFLF